MLAQLQKLTEAKIFWQSFNLMMWSSRSSFDNLAKAIEKKDESLADGRNPQFRMWEGI